MARKVFVSFRFSDGSSYKDALEDLFDNDTEIINCSEDIDRSNMSEATIRKYIYNKLSTTSVTISLLTPLALEYKKDYFGNYSDWLYDEVRYSLEDRDNNRTNGLIAVYTPEVEDLIITKEEHSCPVCNETKEVICIRNFPNLNRYNLMNVRDEYKMNKCNGIYDSTWDSYCSFVSWEAFCDDYRLIINHAENKRNELYKYKICKRL